MKGSRRLNFTEPGGGENNDSSWRNQADSPLCSSSPKSPRKSPKTVMIKSPGSGVQMTPTGIIGNEDESTLSEQAEAEAAKAELQFQFHLSQHYESSPVPPNCTSNGSYEEYMRQKEEEERKHNVDERGDNENQSFTFDSSTASQRDLSQYDPQLAEIATRFVNEIIEKAKLEVVNRQKVWFSSENLNLDQTCRNLILEESPAYLVHNKLLLSFKSSS